MLKEIKDKSMDMANRCEQQDDHKVHRVVHKSAVQAILSTRGKRMEARGDTGGPDGTGCERFGKVRGLHSSELEIVAAHNVNAASATCAQKLCPNKKIAASKLAAQRKAAIIPTVEGQEVVQVFPTDFRHISRFSL